MKIAEKKESERVVYIQIGIAKKNKREMKIIVENCMIITPCAAANVLIHVRRGN